MTKLLAIVGASIVGLGVLVVCAYLASIYGRPPMPLPLGTVLWDYETGFTVTSVARHSALAGMTAYEVTARVFCPYGERYHWTPRSAHVFDNDGRTYYANAGTAAHKILGATDTEHLTFLLPTAIEQPALVFDDTIGILPIIDSLRAGPPELYEPHRFNLRYD